MLIAKTRESTDEINVREKFLELGPGMEFHN
jgi:hypothetical protein